MPKINNFKRPISSLASYPVAIVEALLVEHRDNECYCIDEKTRACGWCAVESLMGLTKKGEESL